MSIPALPVMMRRYQSAIRSFGTSLAVAALFLLLLELTLRILRPDLRQLGVDRDLIFDAPGRGTARLRPHASGLADGITMEVDGSGFWKYSAPADTAKPAWLLLGDSVTMGVGVIPDSSFAGLLAAYCRNTVLLNPAWVGYSSADYRLLTSSLLDADTSDRKLDVCHVTVVWTLNDIYSNLELADEPGQGVRRTGGSVLAWLKSTWRTYQWLKGMLFDRSRAYYDHDRSLYSRGSRYWNSAVEDLRTLRDLCSRHGIAFDVVLLPYEYQCRTSSDSLAAPQHLLSAELHRLGIPSYDLLPSMRASTPVSADLFRFGDGIHLSERGHRVVFNSLAALFCRPQ